MKIEKQLDGELRSKTISQNSRNRLHKKQCFQKYQSDVGAYLAIKNMNSGPQGIKIAQH